MREYLSLRAIVNIEQNVGSKIFSVAFLGGPVVKTPCKQIFKKQFFLLVSMVASNGKAEIRTQHFSNSKTNSLFVLCLFTSVETANKNGIRKFPGSPVVRTLTARDSSLIPIWGTKIPQTTWYGQEKKKKGNEKYLFYLVNYW